MNLRRQSFLVNIPKVGNELPDSVVNTPNVNIFKNRLDRHWREEDFLYTHKAPIPGHHLAEDRARRFEHVDLTIEANACGHEVNLSKQVIKTLLIVPSVLKKSIVFPLHSSDLTQFRSVS